MASRQLDMIELGSERMHLDSGSGRTSRQPSFFIRSYRVRKVIGRTASWPSGGHLMRAVLLVDSISSEVFLFYLDLG